MVSIVCVSLITGNFCPHTRSSFQIVRHFVFVGVINDQRSPRKNVIYCRSFFDRDHKTVTLDEISGGFLWCQYSVYPGKLCIPIHHLCIHCYRETKESFETLLFRFCRCTPVHVSFPGGYGYD